MRILLTGAFGNIGASTLKNLLEINDQKNENNGIICLDIKNKKTQKIQESLKKKGVFETVWGSVTDKGVLDKALKNVDCVIHLAAILAPVTEKKPDLSYSVNVGGTQNIVAVASL